MTINTFSHVFVSLTNKNILAGVPVMYIYFNVVSRTDGIGRIAVAAPGYNIMDDALEDLIGAQESWEQLKACGRPINLRTITDIAKVHSVIRGKWLFYTSTGLKVDHLWSLVAQGVVEGRCGISATVTPYNPHDESGSHVIGVYNNNFTDYEQVMDLEHAVRLLGIKCQMMYKPIIYSKLGIYSNNEWGLQPSVYKSVYDIVKCCSRVMELTRSSHMPSHAADQPL